MQDVLFCLHNNFLKVIHWIIYFLTSSKTLFSAKRILTTDINFISCFCIIAFTDCFKGILSSIINTAFLQLATWGQLQSSPLFQCKTFLQLTFLCFCCIINYSIWFIIHYNKYSLYFHLALREEQVYGFPTICELFVLCWPQQITLTIPPPPPPPHTHYT